jgi:hypothetical protein
MTRIIEPVAETSGDNIILITNADFVESADSTKRVNQAVAAFQTQFGALHVDADVALDRLEQPSSQVLVIRSADDSVAIASALCQDEVPWVAGDISAESLRQLAIRYPADWAIASADFDIELYIRYMAKGLHIYPHIREFGLEHGFSNRAKLLHEALLQGLGFYPICLWQTTL